VQPAMMVLLTARPVRAVPVSSWAGVYLQGTAGVISWNSHRASPERCSGHVYCCPFKILKQDSQPARPSSGNRRRFDGRSDSLTRKRVTTYGRCAELKSSPPETALAEIRGATNGGTN
jgi:hypothetical protein